MSTGFLQALELPPFEVLVPDRPSSWAHEGLQWRPGTAPTPVFIGSLAIVFGERQLDVLLLGARHMIADIVAPLEARGDGEGYFME